MVKVNKYIYIKCYLSNSLNKLDTSAMADELIFHTSPAIVR